MPEALIWGASGGIGSALVSLLKSQGWRVYAAARDEQRVPSEADLVCSFDASDDFSIQQAALQVAQEAGSLDLVVYAAGGLVAATVDSFDASTWKAVLDANLNGAQRAARESIHLLREGGHMMFLGAYVDKITLPKFGAYAAAKAGLEPLVAILQKENRKLKFTLARPGAVDTPFWANVPFSLPKTASTPEAIAQALLSRFESGESGLLDL